MLKVAHLIEDQKVQDRTFVGPTKENKMNQLKVRDILELLKLQSYCSARHIDTKDEVWKDLDKVLKHEINGKAESLAYGKESEETSLFSSLFSPLTVMGNESSRDKTLDNLFFPYADMSKPLDSNVPAADSFKVDWSSVDLENLASRADKEMYHQDVKNVMDDVISNPGTSSLKEKILAWAVYELL